MKIALKKPFWMFLCCFIAVLMLLLLVPLNLFPGEYVVKETGVIIEGPLSLYSFTPWGYDPDMEFFSDFYLTARGYALAACFLIGFPALITYRITLKNRPKL